MLIRIPWNSPLLSGLTFLRLHVWDGARFPTSKQYVRMLTSCPRLKELYLRGRNGHIRDEGSVATFHCTIPLLELRTLSLKFIHRSTIQSILSSIRATPNSLEIIFPSDANDQWEEVITTTLGGPDTSHILDRFISSPHTMRVLQGEPLLALNSVDGDVSCSFSCDFSGLTNAHLYRSLFRASAIAKVRALTLRCQIGFLNALYSYEDLLDDFAGLQELELVGSMEDLRSLLSPLTEKVNTGPGEEEWRLPQLTMLKLEGFHFDIEVLWWFVNKRYGTTPPTCSFLLVVEENYHYDEVYDVPVGKAADIAAILGHENFIWDGFTVTDCAEPEWQHLTL
ncbi:hypothetical protein FRC02_001779 [Tulasnella sp. 418]|nr:hypothetical protein FRC02_001779 [Tulasnella sp. 418]